MLLIDTEQNTHIFESSGLCLADACHGMKLSVTWGGGGGGIQGKGNIKDSSHLEKKLKIPKI